MAKARDNYNISGSTVEELKRALNFLLQRLADRMDRIEGIRGTATMHSDLDMNGNRAIDLGPPDEDTDSARSQDLQDLLTEEDFILAAQDAAGAALTDSAEVNFTYDSAAKTIAAALIAGSIAYNKIQNVANTNRVLGRISSGAGTIEELTEANLASIIGATFATDSTYSDSITWDGTPPSGATSHNFSFKKVCGLVTFMVRLNYAVAGVTNTNVVIALPTGMPEPLYLSGVGASDTIMMIDGAISAGTTVPSLTRQAYLRRNSGGTGFELVTSLNSGSIAATTAYFSGTYFTTP